jgi:hypothetical protein
MSSFRRGWKDYQQGKPFGEVYETWSSQQQLAYERGRRAAAVASYHVCLAVKKGALAPGTVHTSWSAARLSIPKGFRAAALREVR